MSRPHEDVQRREHDRVEDAPRRRCPRMKKRRKIGWSVFRCMYQAATIANLMIAKTSSSVTMSPSGMSPSR